jgi:hypothetical protein
MRPAEPFTTHCPAPLGCAGLDWYDLRPAIRLYHPTFARRVSMFSRHIPTTVALCIGLALGSFGVSTALAQDAAANPGSIRQALEQQLGKRAKLKLVSGQDLEGKVSEVSNDVVIVDELTGMEFFGATVRLDQVAAVIVRKK